MSYLIACHYLAVGFLHVLEETDEVPEARLCLHFVRREYLHLIERRVDILVGGHTSADYAVLLKLNNDKCSTAQFNELFRRLLRRRRQRKSV